MKTDAIWRAFAETGDPVYYLLYKTVHEKGRDKGRKNQDKTPGQPPRAED